MLAGYRAVDFNASTILFFFKKLLYLEVPEIMIYNQILRFYNRFHEKPRGQKVESQEEYQLVSLQNLMLVQHR